MSWRRLPVVVAVGLVSMAGCGTAPASSAPPSQAGLATPSASGPTQAVEDVTDEAGLESWGRVAGLLASSTDSGKPIVEGYSAIIRHASYDPDAADGDKAVTLNIDKVKWNPKYHDGGRPAPVLNPEVKWQTVRVPGVLVLAIDGSRPRGISLEEFVNHVNDDGSAADGFRLPYRFYFVGKRLVAVEEWYLP